MSRLRQALSPGRALIPYITASDPDGGLSLEAALGAVEGGARALEIGIPHSDPVADGPVIQRSHLRALQAGGGAEAALDLAARLRKASDIPIVLFTYANPVLAMGPERFAARARRAGADGVLVLDIPPEEEPGWFDIASKAGLDSIVLLSPNTSKERAARIVGVGEGFVYLVAREGVTGTHDAKRTNLRERVEEVRELTDRPMAVGFGVKDREDVLGLWEFAEAAVVGSSLVQVMADALRDEIKRAVREFVEGLSEPRSSAANVKEGAP